MRAFLNWFDARRRLIALILFGLVGVGVLSSGPRVETNELLRIPDLGLLAMILLGTLALIGLVMVLVVPPRAAGRPGGEWRSLRSLLVLAAVVAVLTIWFGPEGDEVEPPAIGQEQTETPAEAGGVAAEGEGFLNRDVTDIVAIALILLIVVSVVRNWRRPSAGTLARSADIALREELTPAVSRAHDHLSQQGKPRSAVLLAYAALENALADLDIGRGSAETPSEHLARVLADIPTLSAPAVRLGELYELARFSDVEITEGDRAQAADALGRARNALALVESGAS